MSARGLAYLGLVVVLGAAIFMLVRGERAVEPDAGEAPTPATSGVAADRYVVTLPPDLRSEPVSGRLILFFVTESHRGWERLLPARGPFWDPPQPIASMAVTDLQPGASVTVDASAVAFPTSCDSFRGNVRVQAVLDVDTTARTVMEGPGNLLSDVKTLHLRPDVADTVNLRLERAIEPPAPFEDRANLVWIEYRSDLLSSFYGRDVHHRAGVALPPGYADPEAADRRWPTIYVVPGLGARHEKAVTYAEMLRARGIEDIAPMAVHVVLDADAPLGHHGFVDSANNGPRATALVREFIPHLEREFRLVTAPEGRIVTGHSSGGWTSLWLLLTQPEVFGAGWATAPDPVDFRAFQASNLYEEDNLYRDAHGNDRPSFRKVISAEGDMIPVMTVAQECGMEYVLDPAGGSGQQWDGWEAMFSPADPNTGRPVPMFDARFGTIDREVVEAWSAFDISRLVASDWRKYGPIVTQRMRLHCGALDNFYLDRAVRLFKERITKLAHEDGGWKGAGYINLEPDATHYSLTSSIFQRVNEEMRAYLREHDFVH